jgi:hypothetical protein
MAESKLGQDRDDEQYERQFSRAPRVASSPAAAATRQVRRNDDEGADEIPEPPPSYEFRQRIGAHETPES